MTAKAFVALVTCFNDDETLNLDATRAQVRRQVQAERRTSTRSITSSAMERP